MKRKITAMRVLCERSTAAQFEAITKGMTVAQISLHLQSVLAAALTNPRFVVASIAKGGAMALQVGKARGAPKPVLLTLPCIGREERETFRRLVLALTWQVVALIDGPVMPDSSTVVRALISEWLRITTLGQRNDLAGTPKRKRGSPQTKKRRARSSKRRGMPGPSRAALPRRKKSVEKTAKAQLRLPHPDFPDVSARPIDWRPGRRGRPPLGAVRRKDGSWTIPDGYRVIRGKVHPPLPAPEPDRLQQKRVHPTKLHERIREAQVEKLPVVVEAKESAEASPNHIEPLCILDDEGDRGPGATSESDTAAPGQPDEGHQEA